MFNPLLAGPRCWLVSSDSTSLVRMMGVKCVAVEVKASGRWISLVPEQLWGTGPGTGASRLSVAMGTKPTHSYNNARYNISDIVSCKICKLVSGRYYLKEVMVFFLRLFLKKIIWSQNLYLMKNLLGTSALIFV